jgi:hypothetical protein
MEDEVVKKKYSRKDERVHHWSMSSLVSPPSFKKQSFLPLSEFAMFKSLKLRPKPLQFPDYLYISPNYFHQPWSLNTHRRVKNVIVAMEVRALFTHALARARHTSADWHPRSFCSLSSCSVVLCN